MLKRTFIVLLSMFMVTSCYYDSAEELYGLCNTTDMSFEEDIQPILATHCNNAICHSTEVAVGGVILDTYVGVRVTVDKGSLMGSILHQEGYSNMPSGAGQLDSCLINKIESWIQDGAKEH
jgi:hypothetical protein